MLIEVTKEKVSIAQGGHVNEGELNVNSCAFNLPECFGDLAVTACFNGIPVPLVNNKCIIPALKQGTATLGVYAYKESENGVELVYSPEPTCFCVHQGSFLEEFSEAPTFEISEYEQYCQMIKAEYERIETLFSQAEHERNEAEFLRVDAENARKLTFDEYKAYIDNNKQVIEAISKTAIKTITAPSIWKLEPGVYYVSGNVFYAIPNPPVNPNNIMVNGTGVLIVAVDALTNNTKHFYLYTNGKIYFGHSVLVGTLDDVEVVNGAISGEFSKATNTITAEKPNAIPSTKAVIDYVDTAIGGIENGSY